jgi:hypothetical protein
MGQLEARTLGMADLPIVVVPHPIGQLPLEAVLRATDAIYDAVVRALLAPPGD